MLANEIACKWEMDLTFQIFLKRWIPQDADPKFFTRITKNNDFLRKFLLCGEIKAASKSRDEQITPSQGRAK